jgi:hypothetical protein
LAAQISIVFGTVRLHYTVQAVAALHYIAHSTVSKTSCLLFYTFFSVKKENHDLSKWGGGKNGGGSKLKTDQKVSAALVHP